jgi:thiol-disulfide isomerase/thioredoxin
MANSRSEKERRRQLRLAQQEAAEARAKRRERRIYMGLGAGLLALAAAAAVIASSNSASAPALTPVADPAAKAALTGPTHTPAAARAVLAGDAAQANEVLDTTIQAEEARLPGVPLVINQWASWCTNCKFEFPFFQQAARGDANRVAFVGLDSQDSRSNAQAFLAQFPVNYPSVFDPSASQAQSLGGGQGWPTTIYMNAKHEITNVHVGAYPTLQALQQDVARYT